MLSNNLEFWQIDSGNGYDQKNSCIKVMVVLLISGKGSSTKARVVSHEMARGGALGSEVDVPREHGGDAGDLLPLVHHVVARRVRLEVQRDSPRHPREDGKQVPGRGRARVELLAQRLHKPRPVGRVAPRVEPGDGAVCDEKVRVARDLVGVRVRVRHRTVRHAL